MLGLVLARAFVVRLVETGPLEDEPRAGADQARDLALALFVRALLDMRIGHRLKDLEDLAAFLVLVFVSGHRFLPLEIRGGRG